MAKEAKETKSNEATVVAAQEARVALAQEDKAEKLGGKSDTSTATSVPSVDVNVHTREDRAIVPEDKIGNEFTIGMESDIRLRENVTQADLDRGDVAYLVDGEAQRRTRDLNESGVDANHPERKKNIAIQDFAAQIASGELDIEDVRALVGTDLKELDSDELLSAKKTTKGDVRKFYISNPVSYLEVANEFGITVDQVRATVEDGKRLA